MSNLGLLYESLLIKRMQEEDTAAFSILFTAYFADLVMFSATITHNKSAAEEITQDIFVNFWEERHNLKITSSLKSYLLKCVQNSSINWIKHMKIRHEYAQHIIDNSKVYGNETESYLLFSEIQDRIERALTLLPSEVAEAFRKSRLEGLSYEEISKLQSVSLRTIEVRVGKALKLLREHLREYFISLLLFVMSIKLPF